MLKELKIHNFATIEDLTVAFHPGLNVLTGETGAGKSIIIDALNLILGGRADTDSIRTGEDSSTVEALFEVRDPQTLQLLNDSGIEMQDELLVIKRILSHGDKSRAYLNGGNATVSNLAKIGDRLVDIHGQHDHQTLLHPENHVELLDLHGKTMEKRLEFAAAYSEYQAQVLELEKMIQSERDRLQREDLLSFQVKEIDQANLVADEEDNLKTERNRLRHSEKLHQAIDRAQNLITEADGSILELLGTVNNELAPLAKIDPALEKQVERGRTAYYEIQELAEELRDYIRSIEFSPSRLEEIEDRVAEINGLKRKYGADIAQVLAYREKIAAELASITSYQERLAALKEDLRRRETQVGKLAIALAEKREEAAVELKKKVEKELRDLNMKHVQFGVRFDYGQAPADTNGSDPSASAVSDSGAPGGFTTFRKLKVKFSSTGLGAIEFLFSPNPGEDLRPLAKIISGGELSRVMLALKTILNEQDTIPVLIFDEVDAGIGGKVAEKTGSKLKKLAEHKQVFCITHLPQIAGMAETHYRVQKDVSGKRTRTEIVELDYDQRVEEIARMSGGEKITEATLKYAKEMIK